MSNEWYTPAKYIEAAREVMGSIDLDPASCELANQTVRAARYYSKEDDGLSKEWYGNVWLNPPYGRISGKGGIKSYQIYFVERLIREYESGNVRQGILLLLGNAQYKQWFPPLWDYLICFHPNSIAFSRPERTRPDTDLRERALIQTVWVSAQFSSISAHMNSVSSTSSRSSDALRKQWIRL